MFDRPYPDFTACFLPTPARHCRAFVSLVLYRDFTQNLWIVFSQERGQSGAQCTPQNPSPASSLMQGSWIPLCQQPLGNKGMEVRLGLDGLLTGKLTPVFDASPGE
jgi:hypothetical protein